MKAYNWYSQLIRPTWAPPSWIFGPVWTILYVIIAVTFGTVFYRAYTGKVSWIVVLPFVLNLFFNFIFTYIQFGLKNNLLAAADILLVLATLVWAMVAIWHVSPEFRWIAYSNIPYLAWVAFATCVQLTITYLNR
ncbi:MAG: TspO/MBR family protein [bacterium]